ncbi:regulator of cell cycle RGCC [Hippoglossus hippoglossus]|uniref:regulator of cell cycle RGCC n=1 Tax=Hippoglossus hippoglossus TaxID=8267 RepID=UPI00148C1067|nr:regulator of cell cycle RGCC [Hippoglossus hippoglossus]
MIKDYSPVLSFEPLRSHTHSLSQTQSSSTASSFHCSSMSSNITADLELELGELLQEFQDVVEELKAPSQSDAHAYQQLLQEAKGRTGQGNDSGVEDSDYSSEASLGNSLNTSEEELHTAGITLAPKAKLGDTRELESFIDMLDRELAEM